MDKSPSHLFLYIVFILPIFAVAYIAEINQGFTVTNGQLERKQCSLEKYTNNDIL